ncbi:hypothetical protein Lal_00019662 [Lupinus albus]|nr:hypothetical protein Lal_00019662 [Lupinus albus]
MDCQRVFAEIWRVGVVGCPIFMLSKNLRLLKKELKSWNTQVFGNIHDKVKNVLANVDAIQAVINSVGHDEELLKRTWLRSFWQLVGNDVCKSVSQFFREGWLLPNLNSNNIVLIPKHPGADQIEDFRPIALANFQFKIITKFLASMLAVIAHRIVSPQQMGFFKDRHIQDCICLASKAVNLLEYKTFGGNMAIKLDINRGISQLAAHGRLSPIVGPSGLKTPTHVLYADDILIFYKGLKSNLLALNSLIKDYDQASGQHINSAKCKFYTFNGTTRRTSNLTTILGLNAGNLTLNYLGVPLFRGKPRRMRLQPIVDKIIAKLATWKDLALSIMGRVELIYVWPSILIKVLDCYIINFIWYGDTKIRKIVTVAWKKVCTPTKVGGLGFRSIKHLNQAALLKLSWEIISTEHERALFYRQRFGFDKARSSRYFKSSIWHVEAYPNVVKDIVQLHISNDQNKFIWQGTTDGTLSLKATFNCLGSAVTESLWCKTVWSELWDWLAGIFNIHINTSSIESILSICNAQWSPQVKGVVAVAIIHTVNTIWFCRNHKRFENKTVSILQAQSRIKLATSLSGNSSKLLTNNSVENFVILRQFKVKQNFQKAHRIIEVVRMAPLAGWIKINSDGVAHGAPGLPGGGGIFRDY